MRAHLRAGVAIYNAGGYHAAHDAWEERWLDSEGETADYLQGLIQFTAAVYHARRGNWEGTTGLATSALAYLDGVEDGGVNLDDVRAHLRTLARDPEVIERGPPPTLTHEGAALALDDLDFDATAVAAGVLAEERERYDETVVDRAVRYARNEREGGGGGPFVALVLDFVRERDDRDLVYRRLADRVERERSREEDVSGLFE